jgi:hypothetical protein
MFEIPKVWNNFLSLLVKDMMRLCGRRGSTGRPIGPSDQEMTDNASTSRLCS